MSDFTISYSSGWPDWYVSEFYKYFHRKLEETTSGSFDYIELRDLNKQYKLEDEISSDSVFGHYSLIIKCNKNGKMFVHSWYDHAFATLEWCVRNNLDITLFSGVSNITKDFIEIHKNVQPSVYCFEYWSDYELISEIRKQQVTQKLNKGYFAGLAHGVRVHYMQTLALHPFFDIHDKSNIYVQKKDYYNQIKQSKFGVSFNGAANICYRDLELFGLNTLNLRQPLTCVTHEKLELGKHYYNFIDDNFSKKIIDYHAFGSIGKEEILKDISDKVEEVLEFASTSKYRDMITESSEWYERNCTPENQFKILHSFLKDFSIFE
jgi:hypothetical protein